MAAEDTSDISDKKETLLIYDDNYILNIGEHNNEELHEKAASLGNSTLVLLIYARKFLISNISAWCSVSKEVLPEFNKHGQHLYHQGDIPGGQLLLAKIDGEAERSLA